MKKVIINGNNFLTLEGFYIEIDRILTQGVDWRTGHNFDAFNDILRGGFGIHDYYEEIELIWRNSAKSKMDLSNMVNGETIYHVLIAIINNNKHVHFIEE